MSVENELPEGWVSTRLEDICTIIMGQSPPSSEYNENEQGLPFFQGKAEFTDLFPEVRKWCTAPTKIAEENDILLSIRAPVGPTNLAPSLCCIGRGLAAIRPAKDIQVRYVLYAIRAFNANLTRLGTGSTFEAVSSDDVKAFEIPLAPFPEQYRIVAAIEQQFTRLDAGVAALRRAQAKLKRYHATVLKSAVEGKLTEVWRAKHPTTEPAPILLERILKERRAKWEADLRAKGKDPTKVKYVEPAKPDTGSLPELPEGWCWATLGTIADIQLGKMLSPKAYEDGLQQMPYLRNENVRWGSIDYSDLKKMGFKDRELEKYHLEPDDLLVCEGGEAGRCAVYKGDVGQFMYQKALHRVRVIEGVINPYFIQFCMQHYVASKLVIPRPSETTIQHLPLEKMQILPIPLPPLAEQEQIIAEVEQRLSVVSQLEATVEANLKRAERLRQSILKEAFAGRLVPQDPNDKPASVLLERIRKERDGRKKGAVSDDRYVTVANEPVQIDLEQVRQVELWDSIGG